MPVPVSVVVWVGDLLGPPLQRFPYSFMYFPSKRSLIMAVQILEFSLVGVTTALVPSGILDPFRPMGASTRMEGGSPSAAGGRYVKLYPPLPCQLFFLDHKCPEPVLARALSAASSLPTALGARSGLV